jgi:hypothetical protein
LLLPLQIAELQPLSINLLLQRLDGPPLRRAHRPALDHAKLLLLVIEPELQVAELLLIELALHRVQSRVWRRCQRLPLQSPELQLLLLQMKLKCMQFWRRRSAGESVGSKEEEAQQDESDAAHAFYVGLSSAVANCRPRRVRSRRRGQLVDRLQQTGDLERLAHRANGATGQGLIDQLLDTEARHHHDAGIGPQLAQLVERLDAIHAGHLHIHEDEIEITVAETRDARLATRRDLDLMAAHRDDIGNAVRVIAVVIDDKDAAFHIVIER